jgi:prepilin-type N-terminal cleavage/methylation domain-containing protein
MKGSGMNYKQHRLKRGFTIVELVVVIAVLGILAGITIVSYGAWRQEAARTEVQSDLTQVATAMKNARNFNGEYPTATPGSSLPDELFKSNANVTVTYVIGSADSYCVEAVSNAESDVVYHIQTTGSTSGSPTAGECEGIPAPSPNPTASLSGPGRFQSVDPVTGENSDIYTVTAAASGCSVGTLEWKFITKSGPSPSQPSQSEWDATSGWQSSNTKTVYVSDSTGYKFRTYLKARCVEGSANAQSGVASTPEYGNGIGAV